MRSRTSSIFAALPPQPEHNSTLLPRFRRTQSFSVRVNSSISCRYTWYPGQSSIRVHSRSVKHPILNQPFTFLRRAIFYSYASFTFRAVRGLLVRSERRGYLFERAYLPTVTRAKIGPETAQTAWFDELFEGGLLIPEKGSRAAMTLLIACSSGEREEHVGA